MKQITGTSLCILSALSLAGCGMFERMDKNTKEIKASLLRHGSCKTVNMVGYKIENSRQQARFELSDCSLSDVRGEAARLNGALMREVPDYKNIEDFQLVFVDRGERREFGFEKGRLRLQ